MSGPEGSSNGAPPPDKKPFPRLSSFKLPRDLTLGAGTANAKPNKKIFAPNLNVVRNKNKAATPNLRANKKDDGNRRNKSANKNKQNGPSVLKSSGVFSEGLGATERHTSRSFYSRDTDTAAALVRPTMRVKDTKKIDKELEEQKIKRVLGESQLNASDDDEDSPSARRDEPVRLPISAGGTLYSAKKDIQKLTVKMEEVVIKKEPEDDISSELPEQKIAAPEVKASPYDSMDIVSLLKSDKPTMMLLQLPDNLPGRGPEEDSPSQKKPGQSTEEEPKVLDNKCRLTDLEEGKIGRILVYKSGKVKMFLGDTAFDLTVGTQPCFRQDAVSVAANEDGRTGTMINLGRIERKLNVIPDWEAQFNLAHS